MLGLNRVLVGMLALFVRAVIQNAALGIDVAYLYCQAGREVLVCFRRDSKCTGRNRCGETIDFLTDFFLSGQKVVMHESFDQLLERNFFGFGVF